MKADWDSLAAEYNDGNKVLVADVDCTAAGEPLCKRFGVQGFPTIKYFNPPDDEGADYDGPRDLEALRKFAETLGPGCGPAMRENCTPEQLAQLEATLAMPEAERRAELELLEAELVAMTKANEELLESLKAEYHKSEYALGAAKTKAAPRIKELKLSLASAPAYTGPSSAEIRREIAEAVEAEDYAKAAQLKKSVAAAEAAEKAAPNKDEV